MGFKIPGYPKPKPEPEVTIEGVTIAVKFLADRSITIEKYKTIRANSDGYKALWSKLDDECLAYAANRYQSNCVRDNGVTYDSAVIWQLVPELLKRLKMEERA